ncbi:MAG: family transporter [Solirubrobacteraceae bacterium]|nr:family transporter [Solirubrobacteraceae bacterium]
MVSGDEELEALEPPVAEPDRAGPDVPKVVVPRWVQLVMLPLGLLALWALARAAGTVLLAFIAAALLALILNPAVSFMQRRARLPRPLAVVSVYIGLALVFVGVGFLLANPIADQAARFGRDVPNIVDNANHSIDDLQTYLNKHGVHAKIKKQGETALQTLQDKVVGGTSDIVKFGGGLLSQLVTAGLGLILCLVLSIYMLIYGERIGRIVRRAMPPGDGTRDDDYPLLVQHAVSSYVRGQLMFSAAMGTGAGLCLWVYGVVGIFPDGRTYALAFGIFFGLMELVPFVGPFLGALPPVLVALFQDPLTGLWVALLFVAIQQIEGHIVAPQIFGHTLRINPLLVIFALLMGGEIYGFPGALLALPIAAIMRETVVYLRHHLVLEPWGTADPLAAMAIDRPGASMAPRCAECGSAGHEGDSFCRACGAALGPTIRA